MSLSKLEFLCGIFDLSKSFTQTLSLIFITNHVIFNLNTIKKNPYNQTYLPSSSYKIASLFELGTQGIPIELTRNVGF